MRAKKRSLVAAVLLAGVTATGAAAAQDQVEREGDDGWEYAFKDDNLLSEDGSIVTPRIVVRTNRLRSQLIRPRTHFVPELLKTVENM